VANQILNDRSASPRSGFQDENFRNRLLPVYIKVKIHPPVFRLKLRRISVTPMALKRIADTRKATAAAGQLRFCRQRLRVANKICIRLLIVQNRIMPREKGFLGRSEAAKLHQCASARFRARACVNCRVMPTFSSWKASYGVNLVRDRKVRIDNREQYVVILYLARPADWREFRCILELFRNLRSLMQADSSLFVGFRDEKLLSSKIVSSDIIRSTILAQSRAHARILSYNFI